MEISQRILRLAKRQSQKSLMLILAIVLLVPLLGFTYYQSQMLEVLVSVDGQELSLRTTERKVEDVLRALDVVLQPEDRCIPLPETEFDQPLSIAITRAIPVRIEVDGNTIELRSAAASVGELLELQEITLAAEDRIHPELDAPLSENLEISIVRVQRYNLVIQQALPYSVIREESSALGQGFEERVQIGQEGLQEDTVEVVAENGIETTRVLLKTEVVQPVIDEVVRVGTAGVAEYDEISFPYKKMYYMETTGYDPCYYCCGKHPWDQGYGITRSGLPAGRGVVGADLDIFPIGTKLYVEGYGYCVVGDTGGGLIGKMRIDLGFATHDEALSWALKRNTAVYVLSE